MVEVRNITRRFVLQVGFSCNARCRFCYYRESLKTGKVKDYIKKFGVNKSIIKPYKDMKMVRDPLEFCKKYKDNFESLRESKNGS